MRFNVIALALMIVSAIIGAGFATGAELVAFFGSSTLPPFIVALITGGIMFAVMTVLVFTPVKDYQWFKLVYFVFFTAMIAGVTELCGAKASAVAVALSILIVFFGFDKMVFINKVIISLALVIMLVFLLSHLDIKTARTNLPLNWLHTVFMSVLYAGLNCCMLGGIYKTALEKHSAQKVMFANALAALILSFFIMLLLIVIRGHKVAHSAVPVLAIAKSVFMTVSVFICMLTSMYAALFNIAKKPKHLVSVGLLAYALSFVGFANIVGTLYPIIGGFLAIFVFCSLISHYVYRHIRARQALRH